MARSSDKRARVAEDLLHLLERQSVSAEEVRALAGDVKPSASRSAALRRKRRRRGAAFYSDLLFALSNEHFPPRHARQLWRALLAHKKNLAQQLGRDPGIHVAALDYLGNVFPVLEPPTLIGARKMATVARMALEDGLTGLYDHAAFLRRLHEEVARARRYGTVFTLALLDLDDFKALNDRHGHQTGDRVLQRIGNILMQVTRDPDVVARCGGEEFGLLLPRTPLDEARHLAERVRRRIERAFAARTGVTVSLGLAAFPADARDAGQLYRSADRALYASKRQGKNRVTAFSDRRRAAGRWDAPSASRSGR